MVMISEHRVGGKNISILVYKGGVMEQPLKRLRFTHLGYQISNGVILLVCLTYLGCFLVNANAN